MSDISVILIALIAGSVSKVTQPSNVGLSQTQHSIFTNPSFATVGAGSFPSNSPGSPNTYYPQVPRVTRSGQRWEFVQGVYQQVGVAPHNREKEVGLVK